VPENLFVVCQLVSCEGTDGRDCNWQRFGMRTFLKMKNFQGICNKARREVGDIKT
jgi:hypothetical protein